jgi:hypothetical protein
MEGLEEYDVEEARGDSESQRDIIRHGDPYLLVASDSESPIKSLYHPRGDFDQILYHIDIGMC